MNDFKDNRGKYQMSPIEDDIASDNLLNNYEIKIK